MAYSLTLKDCVLEHGNDVRKV